MIENPWEYVEEHYHHCEICDADVPCYRHCDKLHYCVAHEPLGDYEP